MRPLTARCGRYHERACGANLSGLRAHFLPGSFRATTGASSPQATLVRSERVPAAGRDGVSRRGGGHLDGRVGGRRETAHNVTPAADYRTAVLSDSP